MDGLNLLILGAEGQVGRRLREVLEPTGRVITSSRHGGVHPCDLSDADALHRLLEEVRPEVIVNAAAYTAVDRAESDADTAYALNTVLPHFLGEWAKKRDAAVLHYSTDYVFDGTSRTPYRESDPTSPLGVYGVTKRDGEVALRQSGCNHLIVRTAWVYDSMGKNFLRTMLRLADEQDDIDVVDDQTGTPTTASFIARASVQMLTRWLASTHSRDELLGTYHVTTAGRTTWAGFAEAIFDEAAASGRLAKVPKVYRISTSAFPTAAQRPAWSVLDTSLVQRHFGIIPLPWGDELKSVISSLPK